MFKRCEYLFDKEEAAVKCSFIPYYPAGVKMGLGLMGKPGGAWVGHGCMVW